MNSGRPQSSDDSANVSDKDSLFVRYLQHPPRTRAKALVALAAMVTAIGVADHATGQGVLMIFFYLIPIVLASAWLGARTGYAVSFLCSVTHSIADWFGHTGDYTWVALWNRIFVLGIYLGVARCIAELMALERSMEERVHARTRELEKAMEKQTELQNKIGAASRYERSAIGHELHDGLCQQLAAANIATGMLVEKLGSAGAEGGAEGPALEARAISGMLVDAIAQTRQIARGLLLAAVKPEELEAELQELCRRVSRKCGAECVFSGSGAGLNAGASQVDDAQASHLFFIAQEALRNAIKHAGASRIEISLRAGAASAPNIGGRGGLELTVTDDGCGFAVAEFTAGVASQGGDGADGQARLGLMIMRHRAELIGAEFGIESPSGFGETPAWAGRKGTRVHCRLPGVNGSVKEVSK